MPQSSGPPRSTASPQRAEPIPDSLPSESIFTVDIDAPMDLDQPPTPEVTGPDDIEGMRKHVIELGFGPGADTAAKGKGKQVRTKLECELADMVLRLTDPGARIPQDTIVEQANTIQQLKKMLDAQKIILATEREEQKVEWEAEREGWWRIYSALTNKERADARGRTMEDLESINRTLQADKRAIKHTLQETQERLQVLETELSDLRPLLLLKPSPQARSKAVPFSPVKRQSHRPLMADARAEHVLLAARRLGPPLVTDVLESMPSKVLGGSSGAMPQTPKTPRRKKAVPRAPSPPPSLPTPPLPKEYAEPSATPAPGLEQILSAARSLDDGTASPALKRRRIDPPGADVNMTPTRSRPSSYAMQLPTTSEDANRGRTALDVLAEQAFAFSSQETASSSAKRRDTPESEDDAEGSPDPALLPPINSTRQSSLGPAFVMQPIPPHTPIVQESDVRQPVTPSPAPAVNPRKRPRSPDISPSTPISPSHDPRSNSTLSQIPDLPSSPTLSPVAGPSTGPGTMMSDVVLNDQVVADAVAIVAAATVQADKGQLAKIAHEMPKRQRSPYVKWSREEDDLLTKAVAKYGQKWDLVQKALPSRGYHQVRQRWLRKLGVFDNKQGEGPTTPTSTPTQTSNSHTHSNGAGPRLGLAPLSSEAALGLSPIDSSPDKRAEWSSPEKPLA